ncbi:hypothetical protein R6Q59_023685 [Mikania micrantha]
MLKSIQKTYSTPVNLGDGVVRILARSSLSSVGCFKSKKDSYELNRMLTECEGSINRISKMHAKIIVEGYGQNVFVRSKLIGIYAGLDQLYMNHAHKVFDHFLEKGVFLWNIMIQTYAHSGLSIEALGVYKEMCEKDVVIDKCTFTFVLKACGIVKDEMTGRVMHGHVMKYGFYFNVFVGNSLVALYAKCQMMEACRHMFDEIPEKDVVSWNSVISGGANTDRFIEAIELFHTFLQVESFSAPDHATLVSILPVCAQVAEIGLGYWIHCYTIKIGLTSDTMVGSGLIAMYGNSGHLDYARQVFDEIFERNIMVCMGTHRKYSIFSQTFWRVGSIRTGLCFYACYQHVVILGHEHYAYMVDLYGRAGLLMEAVEFIKLMPMLLGKDVYGALLGSCRMHNNTELAKVVADKLFVLDPNSGDRYVTLAKIYGDGGRLKDVADVRKFLVKKNIKKPFGFSSIKVDSVVHTFGVEDATHLKKWSFFDTLSSLDELMTCNYKLETHC